MKPLTIIIFFLIQLLSINAMCQTISCNFCDSLVLTKRELQKCKIDSVWTNDIIIKTNYISAFKTELLPKYKLQRKEIQIPQDIEPSIQRLKSVYDSILTIKLTCLEKEMDKNQLFIQPKAYISSLLSFQVFKFYPDIYAILLNGIHLKLNPQTTTDELLRYKKLSNDIIEKIPKNLYAKLIAITFEMENDRTRISQQIPFRLFGGLEDDDYKKQCEVLNFLMWTE